MLLFYMFVVVAFTTSQDEREWKGDEAPAAEEASTVHRNRASTSFNSFRYDLILPYFSRRAMQPRTTDIGRQLGRKLARNKNKIIRIKFFFTRHVFLITSSQIEHSICTGNRRIRLVSMYRIFCHIG